MVDFFVCLSVAQNSLSLLKQVFRLLQRSRAAYERQKDLEDVLTQHLNELESVLAIIEIIKNEEELQQDTVKRELAQMQGVQTRLNDMLASLVASKTGGKVSQIARQFAQGSADERKLNVIMKSLRHVKAALLVCIQAAQVGVMRNMHKELVAKVEVIQRIHEQLKENVSECKGLRIAQLVKDRHPSEDGTVLITAEDLAHLNETESEDYSEDEILVDDSETTRRGLSGESGRDVDYNKVTGTSMQVNGPIEKDLWENINRVSIKHNLAADRSVQINHSIPLEGLRLTLPVHEHNVKTHNMAQKSCKNMQQREFPGIHPPEY